MRKWGIYPGSHCKVNGQALRKVRTRNVQYMKREKKSASPQSWPSIRNLRASSLFGRKLQIALVGESKCGPKTIGISITWDSVRNAESFHPQLAESEVVYYYYSQVISILTFVKNLPELFLPAKRELGFLPSNSHPSVLRAASQLKSSALVISGQEQLCAEGCASIARKEVVSLFGSWDGECRGAAGKVQRAGYFLSWMDTQETSQGQLGTFSSYDMNPRQRVW